MFFVNSHELFDYLSNQTINLGLLLMTMFEYREKTIYVRLNEVN